MRSTSLALPILVVLVASCGGTATEPDAGSAAYTADASAPTSSETSVSADTSAPAVTDAPAPDTSTSVAPTTVASAGLPAVTIQSVSTGAGSGELVVTVDRMPPGFTRYKVSLDGPNGPSIRARILDVTPSGNGNVAITIYAPDYSGGDPITFAVSWVDGAGVTSALDYHRCATWPSLTGESC